MIYLLLLVWIGLAGGLIFFILKDPREGGALTLAYFLSLSLIHVPGVLPHLDEALADSLDTVVGFQITLAGLAAYLGGAAVGRLIKIKGRLESAHRRGVDARWLYAISRRFLLVGSGIFFVVLPLAAIVQSLTAVLSALAGLMVLGIWLRLYGAAITGDRPQMTATLALLPLLPLATLATGGFLGFGVLWVLSALCFLFIVTRQRMLFVVLSPIVIYIGLSIFVTYMGERNAIRETVWHERADTGDRLERIGSIVTNFRLLDLDDPAHTGALDVRLNQNSLAGKAVARLEGGQVDFAYGGTVPLWSLIPRAVWPDKPQVGGGGTLVSDFTGVNFAEGTSVGAGQVLEFYANFGWLGVLLGFLGLGFLLMWLDRGIMRAIAAGDMRGVVFRGLPGLILLQPGGNLLEIVVGAVSALVAAYVLVRLDARLRPVVAGSGALRTLRPHTGIRP